MTFVFEDVIKLLLAIVAGGVIGAEREFHDKAAGFRTIILICTGATLFTIFSKDIGGTDDPARIAAAIVSGVGFLGAGVIMRGDGHVFGLTTSATIWLSAAVGMGIGAGQYVLIGIATGSIMVVLMLFPTVEGWINRLRDARTYEVVYPILPEKFDMLETMCTEIGLHVNYKHRVKSGDTMICTIQTYGSPEHHARLMDKLFADEDVKEFRV